MAQIYIRKRFSSYLGEERAIDDIVRSFIPDGPTPTPPTPTPSVTPTTTPIVPTPSVTPSVTPTNTPSVTPSTTPTLTPTPTEIACDFTFSILPTPTPTPTNTSTPTTTPTETPTPTPTLTPTSSPVPAFDPDASLYLADVLNEGGTLDETISAATDTLFTSLKSNGLYTKLKVFYPFVGATANSTALMGKRVSGTTYDLNYNGGWTFDSSGATPNGTTGYADTSYPPNLEGQNDVHMSVYNTQESTGNRVDMGSNISINDIQIVSNFLTNNFSGLNNESTAGGPITSSGFLVISRTGSTDFNYFLNGSKTIKTNSSVPPSAVNIYIGARNNNGSPGFFDTKQKAFASIGSGLSDTDVANLTAIINTFQTSLGRNV
jgi:hypothetical protein